MVPPNSISTPPGMHFDAVVFDFFGTLTYPLLAEDQVKAVTPVAKVMGVAVDHLVGILEDTFPDRCRGHWGSYEETMTRLGLEAGVGLSNTEVEEVCRVRLDTQRELMRLRDDVQPTFKSLNSLGIHIGVISDCTHELVKFWPELPVASLVDVATFSVEVGTKKPDPILYTSTADALGVTPEACMYVGDGGSSELTGAGNVGMTPVLLDDPAARTALVYGRENWTGISVSSLSEVLDLL